MADEHPTRNYNTPEEQEAVDAIGHICEHLRLAEHHARRLPNQWREDRRSDGWLEEIERHLADIWRILVEE
jgi:hypothetical protein